MNDLEAVELRRKRWRRARKGLDVLDPREESFGGGGVPSVAGKMSTRLIILPEDPEAHVIDFDDQFGTWWKEEPIDPHTGQPSNFGRDEWMTSQASYRYMRRGEHEWKRYLAISHAGGVEMGLGSHEAVYRLNRNTGVEVNVFRLLTIVGRVATVLEYFRAVIERYELSGPWEVTLALVGTENSLLGDFASGYSRPEDQFEDELRRCGERHLLIRREFEVWPGDQGEARAVAYRIADQVEGAWGYALRRYLITQGDNIGEFDAANYHWR
ncbi:MAG: hypothetical protein IH957_13395 [Chloroflexi bacterium]|nr:hypothetical protein [Chloroflexota bacterium]